MYKEPRLEIIFEIMRVQMKVHRQLISQLTGKSLNTIPWQQVTDVIHTSHAAAAWYTMQSMFSVRTVQPVKRTSLVNLNFQCQVPIYGRLYKYTVNNRNIDLAIKSYNLV